MQRRVGVGLRTSAGHLHGKRRCERTALPASDCQGREGNGANDLAHLPNQVTDRDPSFLPETRHGATALNTIICRESR